jgi:hypothetical protein
MNNKMQLIQKLGNYNALILLVILKSIYDDASANPFASNCFVR